jgi:transcriptional regulator with XRE-family HTH domain
VRQLIAQREQHGWSQRELADRAGMKQPQLARLETGQVEPKLDTLERLAKAVGVQGLREFSANGSFSNQHNSEQP